MTAEELRIRTLERESKAFNLLVNVARSDPSTSGFNTVQSYRKVILKEYGVGVSDRCVFERDPTALN
jgi:hypothetical protein